MQGVSFCKPEGTYVAVPDFENWCNAHGRALDELLRSGAEGCVLWRDGRQFYIPYGLRPVLGLPTKKLEEALWRRRDDAL